MNYTFCVTRELLCHSIKREIKKDEFVVAWRRCVW